MFLELLGTPNLFIIHQNQFLMFWKMKSVQDFAFIQPIPRKKHGWSTPDALGVN